MRARVGPAGFPEGDDVEPIARAQVLEQGSGPESAAAGDRVGRFGREDEGATLRGRSV